MKRIKISILPIFIILITLFATSCTSIKKERTIENVSKVFMHERTHYTLVSKDSSSAKLVFNSFYVDRPDSVELITDVPAEKSMWAYYSWEDSKMEGVHNKHVTIHIHSVESINGAEWNHGKGGQGTTVVIE